MGLMLFLSHGMIISSLCHPAKVVEALFLNIWQCSRVWPCVGWFSDLFVYFRSSGTEEMRSANPGVGAATAKTSRRRCEISVCFP